MTQTDRILNHLQTRGSISQREADDLYGITRLGARGYRIMRVMEHGQNRYGDKTAYARYRMEG